MLLRERATVRNPRSFWTMVVISLVVVTLLQGLAGTPTSPVERWLHVTKVPVWWPFVLAGVTGIAGGLVLNRQMGPQGGAAEQGRPAPPRGAGGRGKGNGRGGDTKGRYAVPRHVRRERERERLRAERQADADFKAREEAEAAAKAAAAAAAAEHPAPPAGWRDRIGAVFGRRPD